MRFCWGILFLLLPLSAEAKIEKILSYREVLVDVGGADECEPGQIFAIYPQGMGEAEPLGYAAAYERVTDRQCMAKVMSHSQSGLIRPGDQTRLLDLTKGNQGIPGRYDLVREGRRDFGALYKPTVYGGYLFGQTASTLDRGEFLVGLTPLMYGVRNNIQVDLTYPRLLEKVLDFGVKYKFYQTEDIRLSIYAQNSRFLEIGKDAWAAELMLDSSSNTRSMTHTRLKYSSKQPKRLALEDEAKQKDSTVEISSVNEWMLKNWNRILLGPKFVAGDTYDLGFLFSFIVVYEHFHTAVNLNVNSVRKLDFKSSKQAAGLDLFWRF